MCRVVHGKSHFFATFDRRFAISFSARCPICALECETGPEGRFNGNKGKGTMENTNNSQPGVSDLIAYVTLIFAIGLAVSLTLAGAVLLLAGQAT
jgi:hypothetical protein